MDAVSLFNVGLGTEWKTIHIKYADNFPNKIYNYHEHSFYEINLILSGNLRILLNDCFKEVNDTKILLTAPHTPHYISCISDTPYHRIYLHFTKDFVENYLPEWKQLSDVFGANGRLLTITQDEKDFFLSLIKQIEAEKSIFGQRLLVYYMLLRIYEISKEHTHPKDKPTYVWDAMIYIENHYFEKIDFSMLSKQLCVGRTKMMTEFKLYIGDTMGEYLCKCRLKNAIHQLLQGQTIECTSEKCGFSDSSSLIRAFKRTYGMTPHKYIKSIADKDDMIYKDSE